MAKIRIKYKFAVLATDVVLFNIQGDKLRVLLIKMTKRPYVGYWACPGGLLKPNETVDAAARRQLSRKAGVKQVYVEQLYTFGKINRDPFGRVVSVAYLALTSRADLKIHTTADYAGIQWFALDKLPKLAYDHAEIIQTALRRLKAKLIYTNIICNLLNKEFTLSELQRAYEIILGRGLDKRNFRKKVLSLKLVSKINKQRSGAAHRPADLYTFKKRTPQIVDML